MPADTPVTTPVLAFTDAMPPLADSHVPPGTELLRVVVVPAGNVVVPDIVPVIGSGVTVTTLVTVALPQVLV